MPRTACPTANSSIQTRCTPIDRSIEEAAHARLLAQSGQVYDAVIIYSSIFEAGYTNETELMRFVELALRMKVIKEAIKATDAVVEHKPTPKLLRTQAALYAIEGDNAKAIALLTKLREQNPNNPGIAFDLAMVHERAKNYDSALAITTLMIAGGVQDQEVLLLHGRLQLALQKFADAKKTFERTQTLYPRNQQASELLKLVSVRFQQPTANNCRDTNQRRESITWIINRLRWST